MSTKAKSTAKKVTVAKRVVTIEFKPTVKLAKVKARSKGGPRTALLNLVPKSGITVAALQGLAKKAELNMKRLPRLMYWLHHNGYLKAA